MEILVKSRGYTVVELFITIIFILVVATIIFSAITYTREASECRRNGGIMLKDAFGVPTCVAADKVAIPIK